MKKTIAMVALTVLGVTAVALAGADWNGAERKAEQFKKEHEALRKLTPEETRKIVSAICEAEEEDRQSVASESSKRVKDKVTDEYDDLAKVKNEAIEKLDAVLGDSTLKDRHGKARDYKRDIESWWQSIDKMTRALRGANHPVVSFMLDRGQKAHKDRQKSCHASEVKLPSGRADCLMATGSTCLVIEFKPNNGRAIPKGKDQVRDYLEELNKELGKKESAIMKELIGKRSDFAKCKEFKSQVDCYKICPSIDEDGEFGEISAEWKEKC